MNQFWMVIHLACQFSIDAFEGLQLNRTKPTDSAIPQQAMSEDEELLAERIQAIHDHFQGTSANESLFEDPIFEEISKAFDSEPSGESSTNPIDQQLDSLMSGIMEEMLSKEVLYEPLKELSIKYPGWLKEHPDDGNIENYKMQLKLLQKIVALFEGENYLAERDRGKIEELVNKLQDLGNPPEELLAA